MRDRNKNKMTKKEKDELMETYESLRKELMEYSFRAKKKNYKCVIPNMPKRTQEPELLRSTIMGFSKRFSNWKSSFKKFEEFNENEEKVYLN